MAKRQTPAPECPHQVAERLRSQVQTDPDLKTVVQEAEREAAGVSHEDCLARRRGVFRRVGWDR